MCEKIQEGKEKEEGRGTCMSSKRASKGKGELEDEPSPLAPSIAVLLEWSSSPIEEKYGNFKNIYLFMQKWPDE